MYRPLRQQGFRKLKVLGRRPSSLRRGYSFNALLCSVVSPSCLLHSVSPSQFRLLASLFIQPSMAISAASAFIRSLNRTTSNDATLYYSRFWQADANACPSSLRRFGPAGEGGKSRPALAVMLRGADISTCRARSLPPLPTCKAAKPALVISPPSSRD